MNSTARDTMRDALRLVQDGQLQDATSAILNRLQGGSPSATTSAPTAAPAAWRIFDASFTRVDDGAVRPAPRSAPGPTATPGPNPDLRGPGPTPGPTPAPSEDARPTIVTPGFHAHTFSSEFGSRPYKLFIPSRYGSEPMPLLIMLHGCTQNPDDFAVGTRMNELAEQRGMLVAYPAQSQQANPTKCWNWFKRSDQQRDHGEPALIAALTQHIVRSHRVDPQRVFVAGLSAGAAMALILATSYSDVYAAVGVHSGLPYAAAGDMPSAFAAMKGNPQPGRAGRPASHSGRVLPTIVFHGDSDSTVAPVNAERISADWTAHASSQDPGCVARTAVHTGRADGGHKWTRTVRYDRQERMLLDEWLVHGAGHAWFGGDSHGTYTDPRGPDASKKMVDFFMASTSRSQP